MRMNPEIVILVIGVLSALAGLPNLSDLKKKRRLSKILFFTGILTALAMNIFQYSFAVSNKAQGRKEVENATAIALYAFENKDMVTLKAVAPDSFLVGYRLFKNGEIDHARAFFEQCIRKINSSPRVIIC